VGKIIGGHLRQYVGYFGVQCPVILRKAACREQRKNQDCCILKYSFIHFTVIFIFLQSQIETVNH
jgi:hypothetical protein